MKNDQESRLASQQQTRANLRALTNARLAVKSGVSPRQLKNVLKAMATGEVLQEALGLNQAPPGTVAANEQSQANVSIRAAQMKALSRPLPTTLPGDAKSALEALARGDVPQPPSAAMTGGKIRQHNEEVLVAKARLKDAKCLRKAARARGDDAAAATYTYAVERAKLAKQIAESAQEQIENVQKGTTKKVTMPPGTPDLAPQITHLQQMAKSAAGETDPLRKAQAESALARERLRLFYELRGL